MMDIEYEGVVFHCIPTIDHGRYAGDEAPRLLDLDLNHATWAREWHEARVGVWTELGRLAEIGSGGRGRARTLWGVITFPEEGVLLPDMLARYLFAVWEEEIKAEVTEEMLMEEASR